MSTQCANPAAASILNSDSVLVYGVCWHNIYCDLQLKLFRAQSARHPPTLQMWKCSAMRVSWMSSSRGVAAAVGVPAALPHDGEPPALAGDDVVRPSNTFRNFFMVSSSFFSSSSSFSSSSLIRSAVLFWALKILQQRLLKRHRGGCC